MKLLFDEHLSFRLVDALSAVFPGSAQIVRLGMAKASDAEVWTYAAAGDFVIVSKDDDFRQRSLVFGPPPKVIWLRLKNCPTSQVESLLRWNTVRIATFHADPVAALLILP